MHQFLDDTMNMMDKLSETKGYFIAKDNISIHMPDPVVIKRGYMSVCLPLYSHKQNLIKQFWAIVKAKIKRDKPTDLENLTLHSTVAAESMLIEHLKTLFNIL
ncbi:hypothetical protein EDC96DRAFT_544765 [Choanephora cucurbitarum]|nr:hypothetical protein EDC96DRAFT_544765 [Choanephora cucurbitarum]